MKKVVFSVALALSVMVGGATMQTSAQTFKDVPPSKEYYEAVELLVEKGAVSKAEKYAPNNNVTRGQLAKIMAITLGLDTKNVKDPKFKDVPKSHQFYPYIAALAQQGVISGYSNGTFGVNNNVTRGHMAKFIVNGFKFQKAQQPYGFFEDDPGTNNSFENATTLMFYNITNATTFNISKPVTRAQIALFLQRAIEAKALDEKSIRISYKGTEVGEYIEMVEHHFSEGNAPNVKADQVSEELYFTPVEPGKYGYLGLISGSLSSRFYVQVSVDEHLNMTAKKVNELEKGYEVPIPYYFYTEEPMLKFTYQPVVIEEADAKAVETDGGEGFYDASVWSNFDGEVIELILHYANGETETRYIHSFLYDSIVFNETMEFFEGVYSKELTLNGDVKLVHGDASAITFTEEKIQDEYDPEYYEIVEKVVFSKPGLYVFGVEGNAIEVVKIGEFNGKKFATWYSY